jgi:hypothetical protein
MQEEIPPLTAVGLRVYSNKQVFYSIVQLTPDQTLVYRDIATIYVPLALDGPERLNFVRNTVLDVMLEYNVRHAAIRLQEHTRQSLTSLAIDRFNLEGVLQESLASCSVEKFVAGQIATLSRYAGIERADFKKLATGEKKFEQYEWERPWSKLILEERESVLASYAALNL